MNTRENDKWAWWCHRELMASLEAKGKVQKPDSKAKRMKEEINAHSMGRVFPETQQLDLNKLLAEAAQHIRAAGARTSRPAPTLTPRYHPQQQQQQQQGADQRQGQAPTGGVTGSGAGYQGTFPAAALAAYTALMDVTRPPQPPGALTHHQQQQQQSHGGRHQGKLQKLQELQAQLAQEQAATRSMRQQLSSLGGASSSYAAAAPRRAAP